MLPGTRVSHNLLRGQAWDVYLVLTQKVPCGTSLTHSAVHEWSSQQRTLYSNNNVTAVLEQRYSTATAAATATLTKINSKTTKKQS